MALLQLKKKKQNDNDTHSIERALLETNKFVRHFIEESKLYEDRRVLNIQQKSESFLPNERVCCRRELRRKNVCCNIFNKIASHKSCHGFAQTNNEKKKYTTYTIDSLEK